MEEDCGFTFRRKTVKVKVPRTQSSERVATAGKKDVKENNVPIAIVANKNIVENVKDDSSKRRLLDRRRRRSSFAAALKTNRPSSFHIGLSLRKLHHFHSFISMNRRDASFKCKIK